MQKQFILFIQLIFSMSALAGVKLQAGDLLLQPLHCWSCSLIEAQTKSPYSHIGVVIKIKDQEIYIAEAYHKVQMVPLGQFLSKTQKGKKIKILRPNKVHSETLFKTFKRQFEGLSYDTMFGWQNMDHLGEKIYCSELIYKLFAHIKIQSPELKPMLFDVHRKYWERYFRGQVPDGELGISPADFDDESLYKFIGFI